MRDVVLHAFNWKYEWITGNAKKIADCGFGAVLFPPPLYSDENGGEWWQPYQPKDYRVIRSRLGRKDELVKAIQALSDAGVRSYADIVFNHMANEKGPRMKRYNIEAWDRDKLVAYKDKLYAFPGEDELARYAREAKEFAKDRLYGDLSVGLFGAQDFNPEGDIDYGNRESVEEKWMGGLPDLDLTDWVVDQQVTCLRELCKLGFAGFRIDAMKHLPVEHLMRVFTIDALDKKFVFGEVITSKASEEDTFLWPIIRHTAFPCYDFPLHETMRQTFAPSGTMRWLVDPAAYGNALPWYRALTFVACHDFNNNKPPGFRGLLMHPQDEYLAKAYIFGRDGGVPLVYSDHNESASACPEDRNRWFESWRRDDIVSMVRFHNELQGTPQRCLYEADGFLVLARGDRGILAINKTEQWQHPRIWTWGLWLGRYRCQIHKWDMDIWPGGDGCFEFAIPPREAQMWLHD